MGRACFAAGALGNCFWIGKKMTWLTAAPRRVLALISVACVGMLAFGMYLQHVVGLEPCPMCIVQRYALIGVALFTGLAAARSARGWWMSLAGLALVASVFGAFVAARQSWLQWYPPEVATCGRDFYGMIENYPMSRAIPMIFRGSGDCAAIDWTFLGGSIANWSFVCFVGFAGVLLALLVSAFKGRRSNRSGYSMA
jgi:disulfide bond formation protein DsbB